MTRRRILAAGYAALFLLSLGLTIAAFVRGRREPPEPRIAGGAPDWVSRRVDHGNGWETFTLLIDGRERTFLHRPGEGVVELLERGQSVPAAPPLAPGPAPGPVPTVAPSVAD